MSFDQSVLDVVLRNLTWIIGNTWLAWAPVLIYEAMHRSWRAWPATFLLVSVGAAGALVRLRDAEPWLAVLVAAVLVALACAWLAFARRGATWARVLAILAIIAFIPNAPYVLTDVYHFQQDIRRTGAGFWGVLLIAFEYAVFLVPAVAGWVVILDRGRTLLRERRPRWPRLALLTLASVVSSFGIYLGRIVRLNSWDPIGHPGEAGRAIREAVTHVGPMAFTFTFAVVIMLVGLLGLLFLDRTHAHGIRGRSLLLPLIGVVWAALLAGSTMVERIYGAYDLPAPAMHHDDAVAVVVASAVLGAFAGGWLVSRLRIAGRAEGGAAFGLVVPVLGVAIVWAASVMWWAQYRGLCEYGPMFHDRGDTCPGKQLPGL